MADRFGLEAAWKQLVRRWQHTTTAWNDPVSRVFHEQVIRPLADQEERTIRELEHLTEIIDQARRHVK